MLLRRVPSRMAGAPALLDRFVGGASSRLPLAAPRAPLTNSLLLMPSRPASLMISVPRSKRFELSTTEGTKPHAALKKYKPVNNSLRHRVVVDKSYLWPGRPEKKLTKRLKSHAGRNHHGVITIRGCGARGRSARRPAAPACSPPLSPLLATASAEAPSSPSLRVPSPPPSRACSRCAPKHRRLYRSIDFKRARTDPAVVQRFEYDPNRSAFIALVKYESDGQLSYILAPRDLAVGATVSAGDEAPFAPGNAMALGLIPDGAEIHNVELRPGRGGSIVRSAGNAARLISKDDMYALLKLPSGETRKVRVECQATIGVVSNDQWRNRVLGKAGAIWWAGRRPKVRGVAMNPVDHPMGGGEGKSSGGRVSCSPWGWYTKGLRTRNRKQFSSKLITRRRNHEKLGLANINTGGW